MIQFSVKLTFLFSHEKYQYSNCVSTCWTFRPKWMRKWTEGVRTRGLTSFQVWWMCSRHTHKMLPSNLQEFSAFQFFWGVSYIWLLRHGKLKMKWMLHLIFSPYNNISPLILEIIFPEYVNVQNVKCWCFLICNSKLQFGCSSQISACTLKTQL